MSVVNLASGGLDSSLISVLLKEEGHVTHPLFIDYGQLAAEAEWRACQSIHRSLDLPAPVRINLSGYGSVINSGLTNSELDIRQDAFTPGRNMLFLLTASSYAFQNGASSVAIGLLKEEYSLFPDQTEQFLESAQNAITTALGRSIGLVAPLMMFTKADVMVLAREKGLTGTYSCHSGKSDPCGKCISCLEQIESNQE